MKTLGLGGGLGSGPFQPAQLKGCVLWLRADQGITVATGVSRWKDLSGAGNDFTQQSAGAQPALSSNGGPLGRPAVVFNGTSSTMTSAASVATNVQNWTQFLVVKVPNTTQSNAFIFSTGLSNGWGFDIAPTGKRGVLWTGTGSGTFGNNTTSWEAWTNWDTAGTNTTCHVNGSAVSSSPTISPAASSGGSCLGSFNAGTSAFAAVSLWEVLVYNRTLSATEISIVEQYIRRATAIW